MGAPRLLPLTPVDLLGWIVNIPGGRKRLSRGLAAEASGFKETVTAGASPEAGGQPGVSPVADPGERDFEGEREKRQKAGSCTNDSAFKG